MDTYPFWIKPPGSERFSSKNYTSIRLRMAWNNLTNDPAFKMLRKHLLEEAPEVCWRHIVLNSVKETHEYVFLNIFVAWALDDSSACNLGPECESLVRNLKNVNKLHHPIVLFQSKSMMSAILSLLSHHRIS